MPRRPDLLQALGTRILYLMALRSSELTACAAALRDLPTITTELAEARALLMKCQAQAEALEEVRSRGAMASRMISLPIA